MIRLLIIAADPTRLDTLTSAFRADVQLAVVGVWEGFEPTVRLEVAAPEIDVVVVDLANPEVASSSLWCGIHLLYPRAAIIEIVDPSIDEAALQASVHAGVYAFVEWTASVAQLCRAARRAHGGEIYLHPAWIYERMAAMFEHLNVEAHGVVQIGPLQVRLGERQTKLHNRPLSLTPLEFGVLAHLGRHAGLVVTPDELLRAVWECDLKSGGTANQVNCCIKRLRRQTCLGTAGRALHRHGARPRIPHAFQCRMENTSHRKVNSVLCVVHLFRS